jgi:serine/threonine-protein kinase HipA
MSSLAVYLYNERVGKLEQDDSELLRFAYDPAWIEHPGVIPLSRSLPLREEPFERKKARPFFAGILPEERPRTQIARILGISEGNDFAMLERIGGECAGAVSLLPEGVHPAGPADAGMRELSTKELEAIVAELPHRPLMAGTEGVRLSLAGAQDKLPVIMKDDRVALPLGGTPSTHILKPEPERFTGLTVNEMFCMKLAQSVGLPAPEVALRFVGGKPCLLVTRYDRHTDGDGTVHRIHQEDFCQAMGYPPERKYQAEGGPTVRDCVGMLRDWSTAPAADIPAFIDSLIFDVLIGNADAHAKNYSMLYDGPDRRLSPFYDLISTLAWPELSRSLAMKIHGSDSVNAFTVGDWKKMADKCGLAWPIVRERLAKVSDSVLAEVDAVMRATERQGDKMIRLLRNQTAQRAQRMLAELDHHKA